MFGVVAVVVVVVNVVVVVVVVDVDAAVAVVAAVAAAVAVVAVVSPTFVVLDADPCLLLAIPVFTCVYFGFFAIRLQQTQKFFILDFSRVIILPSL